MAMAIDMHCDTLMHAFIECKGNVQNKDIYRMNGHLSIEKLLEGKAMAQFLAIFLPPEKAYGRFGMEPWSYDDYIEACAAIFENTLKNHPDAVRKACNADEIENNFRNGYLSAVLTMEDGAAADNDMAKLDHFYDLGVRALSLTWNFENCFGYPNSKDPEIMNKGLKPFGMEAVKHMQELGMLVDVSHLPDGGFWDVYKLAKVPFVATHSNARSVCHHQRNMSDDMIRALHEKGGVMGINFCPDFIRDDNAEKTTTINDIVNMALYEKEAAGVDVIALGTDYDGISGTLEINGPDKMPLLCDALVRAGFTTDDVDLIMYGNVLRVMHEATK